MTNEELHKKLRSMVIDALKRQREHFAKDTQSSYKHLKSGFDKLAKKADQILNELKHIKAVQDDHERRLRQLELAQPKSRSNSLSRFL